MNQFVSSLIRTLLASAAGFLAAKGIALDGTAIETLSAAAGILATIGWSWWEKSKAPTVK